MNSNRSSRLNVRITKRFCLHLSRHQFTHNRKSSFVVPPLPPPHSSVPMFRCTVKVEMGTLESEPKMNTNVETNRNKNGKWKHVTTAIIYKFSFFKCVWSNVIRFSYWVVEERWSFAELKLILFLYLTTNNRRHTIFIWANATL